MVPRDRQGGSIFAGFLQRHISRGKYQVQLKVAYLRHITLLGHWTSRSRNLQTTSETELGWVAQVLVLSRLQHVRSRAIHVALDLVVYVLLHPMV